MKKITALLVCVSLLLFMLTACSGTASEDTPYKGLTLYESDTGISLYMDKGYTEGSAEGVTCAFEGNGTAVSCREELFQTLADVGIESDMTLEEYAALLIEANQFNSEVFTDEYGNVYFTYELTIMENDFTYFAFVDKGSSSFWTTNFICPTAEASDYEKDFQLWASSIIIG